jgi:hypothetical protein
MRWQRDIPRSYLDQSEGGAAVSAAATASASSFSALTSAATCACVSPGSPAVTTCGLIAGGAAYIGHGFARSSYVAVAALSTLATLAAEQHHIGNADRPSIHHERECATARRAATSGATTASTVTADLTLAA